MTQNENKDEMLEFLKRGEVRTMAKDIAVLRKEEAQEERKKIVSLRETPRSGEDTLSFIPKPTLMEPQDIKITLPQKPAFSTKILVRVLIALLAAGVLGLVGWVAYPKLKLALQKKPASQPTKNNPAPPPAQAPTPALQIPAPVFAMQNTKIIEAASQSDILPSLSNFLKSNSLQGFTRIVFSLKGSAATSQEFFSAMNMVFPGDLAKKMDSNFTLFAYSGNAQNRLGFIATFPSTEGLGNALRAEEPVMETDVSSFASIIGPKDKAYIKFFRPLAYKKVSVRCQTFSLQDLGLCYALVDNHFVFTSSLESMKAAIGQLKTI